MTRESPQPGSVDYEISKVLKNCWSCRILGGGGLLSSAAYVYLGARHTMRLPGPKTIVLPLQLTFAVLLASLGAVVIIDPVRD